MKSKLIILIIWFTSIVIAIPTYIAYDVEYTFNKETNKQDKAFCNIIGLDYNFYSIYIYFLFIVQYLIPLCIILYAYLRIGLNLLFSSNAGFTNSTSNRSDLSRMMKNKKRVSISLRFNFCVCLLFFFLLLNILFSFSFFFDFTI